jgi:putative molybdopterin biosynthesis protein
MDEPATLTRHGLLLNKSPGWVLHHIKILETAGLIEKDETRIVGKATEKYYRAKASTLILQEFILPHTQKPVIIFSGSQDDAIQHIAYHLAPCFSLRIVPTGSLDSLISLRQGLCHVAGTHLLDSDGQYNIPFVRRLFIDRAVEMVTLAHRTKGLIVAAGNPKGIKAPFDLAREDVTLINRNHGSETRLWLDRELTRLGLPIAKIQGYGKCVGTHAEAAKIVQAGEADVAVGTQSAAWKSGLGFVLLFDERYDLVYSVEQAQLVGPLLAYLHCSDVL